MMHGVKAMAIIVYCQHCGHDIAVFRKLRTPPELLQILLQRIGPRCPYCGAPFTVLDTRNIRYSAKPLPVPRRRVVRRAH